MQADRPICIVPEGRRLASRASVTLANLADEDFEHGPAEAWAYFYDYLFSLCRKAGFQPHIVQEACDSIGIPGLVSCGMGITILTESICNVATGRLVPLPISDIAEVMVTEAVWASENLRLPTQHFVDVLETHDGHRGKHPSQELQANWPRPVIDVRKRPASGRAVR
ncbi:HTH-type transcriptional regulator GltC [Roseovarius sp. A-2]|uniref:LysR family substrate-binding domain-containing protein n=1 Tax=Roseovarius sp. A-2 TaxID=1570360 RepID=UPI0009D0E11C|nr:LysR family substrate-binding domain-containing protein [Roseovarius sp. A-2]GAW34465.1 HTH-type transcriptional regulator GltC [Roseovarius sp. A-2]